MTITRTNVETIIVARVGALMRLEGIDLDGTTVDGTNEDLNDPIGVALRSMGESVADISSVSDADLEVVAEADFNELLDRTELRTLETIESNFKLVDISTGPRSEKFSQMISFVQARKKQLIDRIEKEYGIASFEAGYIAMDFAEHDDE
ncbi:MAG: hypothetical protein AMJ88_13465 [Anaerolineae bacterium SM23_ 63]|nr:MAG: hypothetical protein AMJ88_13465 [Anaerolineae bacterium SM23_ 63]